MYHQPYIEYIYIYIEISDPYIDYIYICIQIYMIRYVYSIDHVTCSTYVCICAAAILAILVLSATFELIE